MFRPILIILTILASLMVLVYYIKRSFLEVATSVPPPEAVFSTEPPVEHNGLHNIVPEFNSAGSYTSSDNSSPTSGLLTNHTKAASKKMVMEWQDREFILSLSILGFGLIVIGLVLFNGSRFASSESMFKLITVVLVIISALFLIIAGYSSEQIAPVIGLLGTVAGYLLGKSAEPTPPTKT